VPLDRTQSSQLKRFGENVRRERNSMDLTQEKLAELVDLNVRTIQKIEAGNVNILLTTIKRIQKALKCPWDRLME
jgi:transcriptional regulator with XRE-family HTH domain